MKQTIGLILILAMVFTLTAAAAETVEIYRENTLFYIEVTLPAGARVVNSTADETLSMTDIGFIDAGRPSVVITVAPDEQYSGQGMSDLTQEEVDLIISEITMEMAAPVEDLRYTPDGYAYIVVNESTAENDTCDAVMLVNGYFIMVNVFYPDYRELTEQDMAIGPSVMDTFRFVGNTNS